MKISEKLRQIQKDQGVVLVVGLGISGIETALFLRRNGVNARCVEREEREQYMSTSRFADRVRDLAAAGAQCLFGIDGEGVLPYLNDVHLAVLSPGVSLTSAICGALQRRDIPIIGEFELGILVAGRPYIGVTGSNGKTTTVTLIHQMLVDGGISSQLCGNVGTPVVAQRQSLETDNEGELVVEASSYQLESCSYLKPTVSVFLNLSDNHLERHGTLARYLEVKRKLVERQDENDVAILNFDDPHVRSLPGRLKAKVLGFGRDLKGEGARIEFHPKEGIDRIVITSEQLHLKEQIFDCRGIPLRGIHNRYNIAASLLAALSRGVSPASLTETIRSFRGLPHRIEVVKDSPIVWINDSKSTTAASTAAALDTVLEEYPTSRIQLLIGGLMKVGSWAPPLEKLQRCSERVDQIICFGRDAHLLQDQCNVFSLKSSKAATIEAALGEARGRAREGDVVLVSPGCLSFDQFRNFEERGDFIRSWIMSNC